jgi:hypothetical protein
LKPAAGSRFYDAIVDALDELGGTKLENRALIILSDGADHYSVHSLRDVLRVARLYRVEIDVVVLPGDDSRSWTASGRREIWDGLRQIAQTSGGQVVIPSRDPVEQLLDSVHHSYQLGFYSDVDAGESSRIEARIRNRPDLEVKLLP